MAASSMRPILMYLPNAFQSLVYLDSSSSSFSLSSTSFFSPSSSSSSSPSCVCHRLDHRERLARLFTITLSTLFCCSISGTLSGSESIDHALMTEVTRQQLVKLVGTT